jgi:hypothetical protein
MFKKNKKEKEEEDNAKTFYWESGEEDIITKNVDYRVLIKKERPHLPRE